MTQRPNIAIVHEGNQDYVRVALEVARRHGNTPVHLGFGETSQLMRQFEARYRRMSNYDPRFDLLCLKRYFIIQKLMHDQQLDSLFHLDSDVLLFDDLYQFEIEWLKPYGAACGIHMPQSQPALRCSFGAHISYWTREMIDSFCDYLVNVYESVPQLILDKWAWHRNTGTPGGVCDMTMLYMWAKGHCNIANFTKPIGGAVFDYNINSPENYTINDFTTRFGAKTITFRDRQPYGRTQKGELMRFRSLHFQGAIKAQMCRFGQAKGYAYAPLLREWGKAKIRRLVPGRA